MNLTGPVDFYALLEEMHPGEAPEPAFARLTMQPPPEALGDHVTEDDWGISDYHGTPLYFMWDGHFNYDVQYHSDGAWHQVDITGFF